MAGRIVASTLNDDTGVLAVRNGMTGIAKAWIQFTCISGSLVNTGSFNISSIVRNSAGNFTLNFTTAMPNSNYSAVTSGSLSSPAAAWCYGTSFTNTGSPYYTAPTTSSCVVIWYAASGLVDPAYGNVAIFSS